MGIYAKKATELLKKLSKLKATYKQSSGTVFDDNTLTQIETYITKEVYCYRTKASNGDIQSGLASATDLMFLIGGEDLNLIPKSGDIIIVGTNSYTVKVSRPVEETNGEIALHKLVVVIK